MEMWIRWSWLLVVLLYGAGFSRALGRHRRQSNQPAWGSSRRLGQSASRLDSSRSNPRVSGVGSPRGVQSVYGWGSRGLEADYYSRQLPPQPSSSPISVQCGEDSMVVTVTRDFYGNGFLVKASDFSLGSCSPGPQSSDTAVVFDNDVQACGSSLQMTPDFMIYRTALNYNPVSSNSAIVRASPAVVPILCYYPRHGNVSSKAIRPTWAPFSTTVSTEERLAFSMYLMTDDWSAHRSSSIFQLGDIINIEASVVTENHSPMILFVDQCVATTTSNVNSSPSYQIITYNGCLVDGTQDDSSSAFRSPRTQPNRIQFMVDAFRFISTDASTIYITCTLRATELVQPPDQMNKACSYNKATRSWTAVEGSNNICRCCDSNNCADPTLVGTRRWGPVFGGSRQIGKRDVGHHPDEQAMATLGPLLIIGAENHHMESIAERAQASRIPEESEPLELWMLVVVGSVSAVVIAAGLVVIGRHVMKRLSPHEML